MILDKFSKHNGHVWNFSMIGGVKRVNLEKPDDLIYLETLDPKLWTALSCPVNNLEIDKQTLSIIDADKDGQIRVPEVIAAVNWITSVLKNVGDLLKQQATFPLSAINDGNENGRMLLDSARIILKNLGVEDGKELTVEQTSDTEKIFAGSRFNGDGIITEDTLIEPEYTALLTDILTCMGPSVDRGGKHGMTSDTLKNFIENCEKYAAWNARKDADPATIIPLGENTADAYSNFLAVKSKIDDYYIRCRLAAFDPQATEALNLQVAQVETISSRDLSGCLDEIAAYPLARVEAGKALPIVSGINPAWESAIATLKKLTVDILLPGKDSITEADWALVSNAFAAYAAWIADKDGVVVEQLGAGRIREILAGNYIDKLAPFFEQEMAVETEVNNILEVDKLVRYHRDLFTLLKNFVTFYDFYAHDAKAIFQAGTLYIDQRSCDLCIKVSDMPKHNSSASFSGMYLVYCDCTSRATNEKMTIVAALTNGDVDNMTVGRNALFFDRKGLDWDATVIKIIDNPISIRQAFFSPYRKAARAIETQINKMAAAQDSKVNADMAKNAESMPGKMVDDKPKKDPPAPVDVGKFVGIFAAISLALGALGSMLVSVVGGFMKLTWWKMPLAFIGILLIISGPSMIIAYLKLRKRNLAPILDANGWAINARVIVNIQFGNTLTHLAALPRGAIVNLNDPFSKKKKPIVPALIVLIIIAAVALFFLRRHGYVHFW